MNPIESTPAELLAAHERLAGYIRNRLQNVDYGDDPLVNLEMTDVVQWALTGTTAEVFTKVGAIVEVAGAFAISANALAGEMFDTTDSFLHEAINAVGRKYQGLGQ